MTIKNNILLIVIFMITVVGLFINKLTTPRILSANELLANGLYLFESPKEISDFSLVSIQQIRPNLQNLILLGNGL